MTYQCIIQTDKNYAQLDLEAMAIEFLLCRFSSYLLRSPTETIVITSHFPLIGIFYGKPSGSIRTERIKTPKY